MRTGQGRIKWEYFELMHDLHGGNPDVPSCRAYRATVNPPMRPKSRGLLTALLCCSPRNDINVMNFLKVEKIFTVLTLCNVTI